MKNKDIKEYLAIPDTERDFYKGIELYNKYGDNPRLKNLVFTQSNNSAAVKKTLCYELAKLIDNAVEIMTKESQKSKFNNEKAIDSSNDDEKLLKTVKTPDQTLRKEFPLIHFNELPDVLKILVIDRISNFNAAKDAKISLADATTDEDRHKYNKILVDSMLDNQRIWDELNYYQTHKKILGKHIKLTKISELDKLKDKSKEELFKLKQNIPSYISKANSAIKENPDNDKIIIRKQALIEKYNYLDKEIDKLLGI